MREIAERNYKGKVSPEKYAAMLQLADEVEAALRLNNILFEDTGAALELASQDVNDGFRRRTLVRTLFAHIEGTLSRMRQVAIYWHRLDAIRLSDRDLRRCADEAALVGLSLPRGKKPIHMPLKDAVKFSFKLFGSTPGKLPVEIDAGSQGWRDFCEAIKVRDKLAHPKIESDLLMLPEDSEKVMRAWMWWVEISSRVLSANAPVDFAVLKAAQEQRAIAGRMLTPLRRVFDFAGAVARRLFRRSV